MSEPTYVTAGTVLAGRYEIGGELGRGGFSVVYRAKDLRVPGDVAIKLLVPPPATAKVARERLRREVQAVRQLSHPNIVPAYDVLDDGPWAFVVMDLVEGSDLAVSVRQRGPLGVGAAVQVGREMCDALDFAHRRGILHRDVKPQNILMTHDGHARLTDFGSARVAGQETVTQTGAMVGTLDYAAPELRAGGRGDARSDEYALGVTLFFALTGVIPPRADPVSDGLHPQARRPDIPGWLDAVVTRATMPDPERRFPAVHSMGAVLAQGAQGSALTAAAPAADRCVLCGGPEPLGLGLCPGCARRGSTGALALLFLGNAAPNAVEKRLGGHTTRRTRRAAIAGERPLLRLRHESAALVMRLLEAGGIPTRVEGGGSWWHTTIPAPIGALIAFVALGGIGVGFATPASALLLTSPLVAVGLAGGAVLARRTPIWDTSEHLTSAFPEEAVHAVARVLSILPFGHARALIVDLLRRVGGTPSIAERAGPLVIAACEVAQNLAGLDEQLAAFDEQRDRSLTPPTGWVDALARCELSRDLLTQKLLEASAAVSAWHLSESGGDLLSELAGDLRDESQRQAEATREVAQLLG